MQETCIQPLGRKNLLEKEMATHSSILAWEIARTKEPGWLESEVRKELDVTEWLNNDMPAEVHTVLWVSESPEKYGT